MIGGGQRLGCVKTHALFARDEIAGMLLLYQSCLFQVIDRPNVKDLPGRAMFQAEDR